MNVIGYIRVSTSEQADSGLGLEAQRTQLQRAAELRGWTNLTIVADEGRSGANLRRAGIRKALRAIANGDADALAVVKLDRLSRSTKDSAELFHWFNAAEAGLIALDFDLDTTTATGKLIATFMAALAEWERDTIAARTRAALAELRRQGKPTGRPAVADDHPLNARIRRLRASGMTMQAIADQLNHEGIPTPRGGERWRISSVQTACGYQRPSRKAERRSTLPPVKGPGRARPRRRS